MLACTINRALLPIKFYFLFYLGGLACITPFMPVFAGQLGFTAGELSVVYGILPFVGLLSKPVVGMIADKLNAHRNVLLVALIVQAIFTFVVYFLPPMSSTMQAEHPVSFFCNDNSPHLYLQINSTLVFCNNNTSAETYCQSRDASAANSSVHLTAVMVGNESFVRNWSELSVAIKYQNNSRSTCSRSAALLTNCTAVLCKDAPAEKKWVRSTYQFWVFLIMMTIGRIGDTAVYTLADSITFDVISQQKTVVSYGKQRAFGSIGWAVSAVVVGLLMDTFSEQPKFAHVGFAPAFYGFVILLFCALITAFFLKPSANIQSKQLLRNVMALFKNMQFVAFSIGTLVAGMLTGILYAYLFLFMANELHAPKLLMGLSQLAECVGEVPFLFLSSWLIGRLSYHGVMVVALASFSIRYICYFFITTTHSWWILVLELLHGPGFGLFYANMATFANDVAPPGAAATMQGVLGGIYDGFGVALGGLIGGSIYEYYGARTAWLSFGVGAGIAACLYSVVALVVHRQPQQQLSPSGNSSASSLTIQSGISDSNP